MDRRTSIRRPFRRCVTLATIAVASWATTEGRFALAGIDWTGLSFRRWLIVYEAMLRLDRDEEQMDELDDLLDPSEHASESRESTMARLGGEVSE